MAHAGSENLGPAEVADASKRLIQPDKATVVLVGDRKKIEPQLKGLTLPPVEYRDADGNPTK